jgi:hypothetical protein
MCKGSIVSAVCQIPIAYRKPDGESLQQLVLRSGYFDNPDELSVDAVEEFLRDKPELVNQWFYFCEDKRTSSGWYIVDDGQRFLVGQIGGQAVAFLDRVSACAEYVVREIGSVAQPRRL